MKVDFEDEELELLAYEPMYRSTIWDRSVVRSYRKRIQQFEAAVTVESLLGLRARRLQPWGRGRSGLWYAPIDGLRGLVIKFDVQGAESTLIVLRSDENNQGSEIHVAQTR